MKCHINKVAGEKPTNFLRRTERQIFNNNAIHNLADANGNFYDDSTSVRQYVNTFYKTLYTSEDIDNEKYEDVLNSVDSVVFEEDVMDDLEYRF